MNDYEGFQKYPCLSLLTLCLKAVELLTQGAKRVQEVDALRGEKGAQLAAQTLGSGETSLGDALWCCANLYSDIKLRLAHKRLMIFTCRDNPHEGDSAKDRQARTKASDLKETGQSASASKNLLCSYRRVNIRNQYIVWISDWRTRLAEQVKTKTHLFLLYHRL